MAGDIVDFIDAHYGTDDDDLRRKLMALADETPVFHPEGPVEADETPEWLEWVPFPVEVLPDPVGRFVQDGAAALGCDPALIALPALAAVAGAIGATRRIRLKSTWVEPSVLWAVSVQESGTLKSPGQDLALAPLVEFQGEAFREHDDAMAAYAHDKAQYERDHTGWKKKGRHNDQPMPEEPIEPTARRFLASDITIEALATILDTNPRGILLARDGLSGWFGSFDAYRERKGGDVAQWLELHRAGRLLVDRKTGARRTIHVDHGVVSLAGTIQPGTLARALSRKYFECGLAARLLLAGPPRRRKKWTEADVSKSTRDEYGRMFREVLKLRMNEADDGRIYPVDVPLSESGRIAWIAFYNEFAGVQADAHGDVAAVLSKLEGAAARPALVCHFARSAVHDPSYGDEIDERSIHAGVTLARWFAHEARRIYQQFRGTHAERDDRRLIEFIEAKDGTVSVRDVVAGCRRLGTADAARAALKRLKDQGRGDWHQPKPGATGGRPSEVFCLFQHPAVCKIIGATSLTEWLQRKCRRSPSKRMDSLLRARSAPFRSRKLQCPTSR